jgi:NAD(P)-dependent dehydrogenase (short-subunit alcohol dehydrogenase family)
MTTSSMSGATQEVIEKTMADIGAIHPIGRVGAPREIADVAVFLASNESSFMTGSEGEFS